MVPSPTDQPSNRWSGSVPVGARDPAGLAALIIVAATVVVMGTPRQSLLVLPALLVAGFVPSTAAFAAGQLAVFPILSVGDGLALAVAQLALLVVVTEPARTRAVPFAAGMTLVAAAGLALLVVAGLQSGPFVASGAVCIVVVGGTSLACRLTRVQLGLVTPDAPADASSRVTTETAVDSSAPDRSAPGSADQSRTEAKE